MTDLAERTAREIFNDIAAAGWDSLNSEEAQQLIAARIRHAYEHLERIESVLSEYHSSLMAVYKKFAAAHKQPGSTHFAAAEAGIDFGAVVLGFEQEYGHLFR